LPSRFTSRADQLVLLGRHLDAIVEGREIEQQPAAVPDRALDGHVSLAVVDLRAVAAGIARTDVDEERQLATRKLGDGAPVPPERIGLRRAGAEQRGEHN
jgi:hypothetical protein